MKGIVYNLLESCVCDEYGESAWEQLLSAAEVDGAHTALGDYPDSELTALVVAAAQTTGCSSEEIVRWFGRRSMPLLARRYPQFFSPHAGTRGFVYTLNDLIHPEARRVYAGADTPMFTFDGSTDDLLVMGYRSPRRLCAFAEGLLEGAAAHYGEQVTIEQPDCMLRGADRCRLEITLR